MGRLTAKYQPISLMMEGIDRFAVQGPDGRASVDEGFHVGAVELLRSDREEIRVQDFRYCSW